MRRDEEADGTYAALLREVAERSEQTVVATRAVLETFRELLATTVWRTGRVVVPGLGTFSVRKRKARRVLDPINHAQVLRLPTLVAVHCRVAKSWRKRK